MNNLKEITNTAKVTYSYIVEPAREEVIRSVEATVSNPFFAQPSVAVFMRAEFSCHPADGLIYYLINISNQSSSLLTIQLVDALPPSLEVKEIAIDGKMSNISNINRVEIQLGEIQPNQIISVVILAKVKNLSYQEEICNQVSVMATYLGVFQTTYTSNETTVLVRNKSRFYSPNTYTRVCPPIKPIYKMEYVNTRLFDYGYRYFMRRVKNKVYFYVRIWGMLQVVIRYRSVNGRIYSYQYITKYSQDVRIDEMRMQYLVKDFLQFEVQPVQVKLTGAGCRIFVRTAVQKNSLSVQSSS